ncbi:siroheme decarboxylase subunit beta [Azospirillum sp. ST 5-10]|uniref:siroheme decarboxylase subunit beta n=1 Tax=unclassified Azospirillum TaxID=2630922 RepID=UPI003F4A47E2
MEHLTATRALRGPLLAALRDGLPLVERPFAAIAADLGADEEAVIAGMAALAEDGALARFGVIVDHHALGYTANAMVVWAIPDDTIATLGARIAASGLVSLCYRRRPSPPLWPYSLYTMVHGKDRDEVARRVAALAEACGVAAVPREILFTVRRFKQTAPCYGSRRRTRCRSTPPTAP